MNVISKFRYILFVFFSSAAMTACGPGMISDTSADLYLLLGLLKLHSWNPVLFSNGQSADVVIGQSDFTTGASAATVGADNFKGLAGNPTVVNGVLYLPDFGAHRVLGFDSIPTTNGASADFVLGQPDFLSSAPDFFNMVGQLSVDGDRLFVVSHQSMQVDVFSPVPTATTSSISYSITSSAEVAAGLTNGFSNFDTIFVANGKMAMVDSGYNRVLL